MVGLPFAVLPARDAAFLWETSWVRLLGVAAFAVAALAAVYASQLRKLRSQSEQLRQEKELRRDVERLQAVLKVSEERFSKAFNANPMPMAITTVEGGRYVDANPSF